LKRFKREKPIDKEKERKKESSYRDRDALHKAPLPHHAAYGSVLRDSADQAESDPGELNRKSEDSAYTEL
jgi:hypothetical protein